MSVHAGDRFFARSCFGSFFVVGVDFEYFLMVSKLVGRLFARRRDMHMATDILSELLLTVVFISVALPAAS